MRRSSNIAEEQGLTTEAAIEAGMKAKSGEFREQGGEIYVAAAK